MDEVIIIPRLSPPKPKEVKATVKVPAERLDEAVSEADGDVLLLKVQRQWAEARGTCHS